MEEKKYYLSSDAVFKGLEKQEYILTNKQLYSFIKSIKELWEDKYQYQLEDEEGYVITSNIEVITPIYSNIKKAIEVASKLGSVVIPNTKYNLLDSGKYNSDIKNAKYNTGSQKIVLYKTIGIDENGRYAKIHYIEYTN